MTNEEILQKSIGKARRNGFDPNKELDMASMVRLVKGLIKKDD